MSTAKDKINFQNTWSCNKTTGRRSGSGYNSCSFLGKFHGSYAFGALYVTNSLNGDGRHYYILYTLL